MDVLRTKQLLLPFFALLFTCYSCSTPAAEHKAAHKVIHKAKVSAHKKLVHKKPIQHKHKTLLHKTKLHKPHGFSHSHHNHPANYELASATPAIRVDAPQNLVQTDLYNQAFSSVNNQFASELSIDGPENTTQQALGVVSLVRQTVTNLHYSSYKYGGTCFDPLRGIYILDCSNYVDRIIQSVYPYAYQNLAQSTGTVHPSSRHYYNFISRLPDIHRKYWNKVKDVGQLQPGDVLVFHYQRSGRHTSAGGGHVMLVMNKPVRTADSFIVQVADSAFTGHSQDTRARHASGIGIGNLLLKVNPLTGHPVAYAWRLDSSWVKNVRFAMVRPVSIHL